MSSTTQELGQEGEQLAAEFLVSLGYQELARNLRFKQGEIDLLMQEGEVIVVVEVKTQRKGEVFDPLYKISPLKYRKLNLLAQIIAARYPNRNVRIDAVTLYWKQDKLQIHHYLNI